MRTLIAFDEVKARLNDFEDSHLGARTRAHAVIRGITRCLIYLEWEGTPSVLSDAILIEVGDDDLDVYQKTLSRLGYDYHMQEISAENIAALEGLEMPCFIQDIRSGDGILMKVDEEEIAHIYNYHHNMMWEIPVDKLSGMICHVTHFSRLFRQPPAQSQDKRHWVKHCFYHYGRELKTLLGLSFVINFLGLAPPFFIIAVYNFALSAQSISTLLWLAVGGILAASLTLFYKKMRFGILNSSGKELSIYISYHVLSKLLWLPYAMTSSAGVSAQLARLRDIDQIRGLATSNTTISYFDLPFVVIFLIAIFVIAGSVALSVLAGVLVMIGFCLYARFIYQKSINQSSRANALVSHQWHGVLMNLPSIQGLPILNVIAARFQSTHHQAVNDTQNMQATNAYIQRMGRGLIQIIGTTTIVVAVLMSMSGASNAGAMIAIIILVWKVLTPIMGVYNAVIRFQTSQNSSNQINNLMSLDDNRQQIEKSTPIDRIRGDLVLKDVTQRYPGFTVGLTQINMSIKAGDKVGICGPAGCGKTTLLNIMSGIWESYQGAVYCDGYNIRQFNNFTYRHAIRYIPMDLHFFEGTLRENIQFYNGFMTDEKINELINFFELAPWLGDEGIDKIISQEFLINLPNGAQQMMRLFVGLGEARENLILMDEPLLGCADDYVQKFNLLLSDYLKNKTVIFTTNEKKLVTLANQSLLLDGNGAQKYYGFPDKLLAVM